MIAGEKHWFIPLLTRTIAPMKVGIIVASLGMAVLLSEWGGWPQAVADVQTGCRTDADCGCGGTCNKVVDSRVTFCAPLETVTVREGCRQGCLHNEECVGGRCVAFEDSEGISEVLLPGEGPRETVPIGARPSKPPPPEPDKLTTELKRGSARIKVFLKGAVNLSAFADAFARLDAALKVVFSRPHGKKENNVTLYVVGGTELSPDLHKFFVAQGFDAEKLRQAFDPSEATHGLTFNNISIVPADKAVNIGNYGLSNIMKHEVGHALSGRACGDPHPCGGVMQTPISGRVDLPYDDQFTESVTNRMLTLVPEVERYTAVWQPSTENEVQVYEWSYKDYRAKYDELWQQGWRLKLLTPYVINNEVRYTAVWRPSTEAEIQVYDASYEAYRTEYDKLWNKGWRLKLLSVYVINNEVRYTAVWRAITEPEIQLYGWSIDALRARYDELWQQGWRLKLLSPYVLNGIVWYTAVFKPSEEGEIQLYGWNYNDYRAEYDKLGTQGWRLKLLNVF